MDTLIYNARVFTNGNTPEVINNASILIENGRIKKIAPAGESIITAKKINKIDAMGKLVMPGWINTHMHFYSTYARGLALKKSPQNFKSILSDLWWQLDKALDDEAVCYSALIPAITAIKCGVTSVIDHHASPNAIDGSLDRIESAIEKTGLRAVLCYEVSDRDGKEKVDQGLRENERYIKKCADQKKADPDHLYDAMFGLHASFTLSDKTLTRATAIRQQTGRGFHFHLCEGEADNQSPFSKERAIPRLARFGILGSQSIAAHAIHINDKEIGILAESGTMVVHNPQSNMNNAVGRADIFKLLQNDVLVGLGSDGMTPAIVPDIRAANLIHKHALKDPTAGWLEIGRLALKNNPLIFERVSDQKLGAIIPGYLADLIIVDYYPPTHLDETNFWGHLLFGIADAPVNTVMINGRVVMRDKQLSGVDEREAAAKSRELAANVWEKII